MAQSLDAVERPAVELGGRDCPYPPMVSFEHLDGSCEAFSYKDLTRLVLNLDGTVKVNFRNATVVVRGRDLLPVWQGFRTRRLRLLRVKSETDGVTLDHGAPHIDSITVTPLRARK